MENSITEIVKILKSPADAGATTAGASSDNQAGTVIGALGVVESLASTLYKSSLPGASVLGASILNNYLEAKGD